jgi:hypothetical protein
LNELRIDLDTENPKHRQFARLLIAGSDIKKARNTALLIVERIESVQHELFEPLSCATAIYYARPFIVTKKYPGIPGRFQKFTSQADLKVHEALIRQRNLFEAHVDKDATDVFLVHKDAAITVGDSRLDVLSHTEFIGSNFLKLAMFRRIAELCNFQLERLETTSEELKARLFP